MIKKTLHQIRNWLRGPDTVAMRALVEDTDHALSVVAKAGYQVHIYSPELNTDDPELRKAFRVLARTGQFIVTDRHNDLIGLVANARTGSEIHAQKRRAQFKIVE
jgi:hypothetical protein